MSGAHKITELTPFSSFHFASHLSKKRNNAPAPTLWESHNWYRGRAQQPAKMSTVGKKADSTLRSSQAVPHPSTNRALRRLTLEVGRDPAHLARYGRQRMSICFVHHVVLMSTFAVFGSLIGILAGHIAGQGHFGAVRLDMQPWPFDTLQGRHPSA